MQRGSDAEPASPLLALSDLCTMVTPGDTFLSHELRFKMFVAGRASPHIDCLSLFNLDITTCGSRVMVAVKYEDLSGAFEFVSYAPLMEH